MKRAMTVAALVLCAATVSVLAYFAGVWAGQDEWSDDFSRSVPAMPFDAVLDGDTIVDGGRAVHVAGLDAPELGPWAQCWAEAALAGEAKSALERALIEERGWQLTDVTADAQGRLIGKILDKDGYDIADEMRIYGGSAMTDGRWDWCGEDADLHDPLEGGKPPMGPSLWWPSGSVFDARAAD